MPTSNQRASSGLTLIELIVVLAVIATFAALVAPAISTSSPRRAAILELQSALEAARSSALANQTEVYVALMDATSADASKHYRQYGVFARKRDPSRRYFANQVDPTIATYAFPTSEFNTIQAWTDLPDGILLALGSEVEGLVNTAVECPSRRPFPTVSATGAPTDLVLPFIMFNEEGRLQFPQFYETDFHYLAIVEGIIAPDGSRVFTRTMPSPSSGADIPVTEVLGFNLYSGRIRLLSQ